jgi:hypothetical protein
VRSSPLPASTKLDRHLAAAIQQFSNPFSAPPKQESEPTMRGMERLANLTDTLMNKIDDEADKAADEIELATGYALDAVGKFRDQGKNIRKKADDILSQLGQTTNMPPPAPAPALPAPEAAQELSTADMLPEVKLIG